VPVSTVSIPVGQWFTDDSGRWWFDSGSFALDFAYTGSMGDDPAWEQWHEPAHMAAWIAERFGARLGVDADDLVAARRLRDTIAT
jgi:hypothetical protein